MASVRTLDRIYSAVADGGSPLGPVSGSWQRSLTEFHLDPENTAAPHILTQRELTDSREPLGALVNMARADIDRLYAVMHDSNYVVLVCDTNGVVVDHRGDESEAGDFKRRGIWLGGVWAEQTEGTNGIGTSISERRPVTVYQGQHFRTRNRTLSCSGAPIFSPDGGLLAVLDVSSMDPRLSEAAHALSLRVTVSAAQAIEERLFRHAFARWSVVSLSPAGKAPCLTAIDNDMRVVGADRAARRALKLDDNALGNGTSLWTLFDRSASRLEAGWGESQLACLRRIEDASLWHAVVTPPATLRHDGFALLDIPAGTAARRHHGGLSPSALRRVKDYIEENLTASITLKTLANVAELSVWHFAHEFKQTVGEAPHGYVLGRRVERARRMLISTDLPLAEIALAAGFTDHSHLARHFRRRTGMTPNAVRRRARTSPVPDHNTLK